MLKVCFIADKDYVAPVMAAINSLIINNKPPIEICVLAKNLIDEEIWAIEDISNKEEVKIQVKNIDKLASELNISFENIKNTSAIKLFLANIFHDTDKILYLDADTLVLKDLNEFFDYDISNYYAACVQDIVGVVKNRCHEKYGFQKYFNSGVMLLNLKKIREDNILNKIFEYGIDNILSPHSVQDALNFAFNQNVLWLPFEYNLLKQKLDFRKSEIAGFYEISIEELKQISKKPFIAHYNSTFKPWKYSQAMYSSFLWFSYFVKLPNSNIKKTKLKDFWDMLCASITRNTKKIANSTFCVRNSKSGKHKILTILSVKIKIRSSIIAFFVVPFKKLILFLKYILLRLFMPFPRKNSVLLVEAEKFHGELIPGIAKYFLDQGFLIDILLSPYEYNLKPLCSLKDNKIRAFKLSSKDMELLLKSKSFIRKYEYVYLNSDYQDKRFDVVSTDNRRIFQMFHNHETIGELKVQGRKSLVLHDFKTYPSEKLFVVNSHYFGDIKITDKNPTTNFIIVGNIEQSRRNYSILNSAIKKVSQAGFSDFKITVVAKNGLLPSMEEEALRFFDFKGCLSYEKMYKEMEEADFLLTLTDSSIQDHEKYLKSQVPGAIQLVYGFLKPCLIENKYANEYGFNEKSSILYEKAENLADAMIKAIKTDRDEYAKMQNHIKALSARVFASSYCEIRNIIKETKTEK